MRHLSLRRVDLLCLFLILIIAASLRLGYAGVVEYRKDEALLTIIGVNMAQGKGFPLLGIPSSIGFPNSPMTAYVLAPPFWVSPEPLLAVAYIAILNVIGVGLLWLIGYRYFGRGVALVAGLTYAVNPWAVMYSRKIWAQDYHTPIILLAILLMLYGFVEKKRWAQIICLPILLIGLQIHFAAWSLVPVYVWLLWTGRKNTTWRRLVVSVLLGAAVIIPYGVGIVQSQGQYQTRLPGNWSSDLIPQPAQQAIDLATGLHLEGTFARDQAADFLAQVPQPAALWMVSLAFGLMGLIAIFRKWPRYLGVMVIIWAFITVIVVTLVEALGSQTHVWFETWPHYYIPSIPAFCLLIGIGVTALATWRPQLKVVSVAVGGVAGAIFVTQFVAVFGLLHYVDTHFTTSRFGFGVPLHDLLDVRDALRSYDDIVTVNGDGRDLSSTGAILWMSLLHDRPRCIRDLTVGDSAAVFPNHPFAAVFSPRQSKMDVSRLKSIYESAPPTVVNVPQGGEPFQIYGQQAAQWTGAPITDLEPTTFSSEMALTGYNLSGNTLTLRWTLPAPQAENYTTVVSYLAADNTLRGQQKSRFWETYNWCEGDTLIDWMKVDVPNGTTQLGIGLAAVGNPAAISMSTGESMVEIAVKNQQ